MGGGDASGTSGVSGRLTRAPHEPQKIALSLNGAPQLVQNISAA